MRMRNVLVLLGLSVLAGCRSAPGEPGTYQQPGRLLEKEIQERIAAFEYESGVTLLRSQKRLAYIGEPAIPYLLDGLRRPSPLTRGSCAYVLGLIRDIRPLGALRRAATEDDIPSVRYEAASALLNCGDSAGYPVLIHGLRDEDIRNRYKCFEALHAVTGLDLGYKHDAAPEEREAAAVRWDAWWEVQSKRP